MAARAQGAERLITAPFVLVIGLGFAGFNRDRVAAADAAALHRRDVTPLDSWRPSWMQKKDA